MNPIARALILGGVILILVGLIYPFGSRIFHLGNLPGDLSIERGNFKFYFPMTTSLVLSLIISGVLYIIQYLKNR